MTVSTRTPRVPRQVGLTGITSLLFQFVGCGGATFVMMQAARSRKYFWVAAFALIAIYFNPVIPVILPRSASVPIALACCLVFFASVFYLRPVPRMSLGHDYRPAGTRRSPLITVFPVPCLAGDSLGGLLILFPLL